MPTPDLVVRMDKLKQLTRDYLAGLPTVEHNLETWDYARPVPVTQASMLGVRPNAWLVRFPPMLIVPGF